MNLERDYAKQTSETHLKKWGQFFTPYPIAQFMASWTCKDAKKVLDPSVGNSIFLTYARVCNPSASLTGYEIDEKILSFFGNPADAHIHLADYLLSGWEERYDAICCNPPYHKFQAVSNRDEILSVIKEHTGIRYSSYTNLYILFLLKSLYQLSPDGRLSYIIPSEFLNSAYGTAIKEKLVKERLLRAIISFDDDNELFFNATTTCCILLVDRVPKTTVCFYHLDSLKELNMITLSGSDPGVHVVSYDTLSPDEKWRHYLSSESASDYKNLVPLSTFCQISRGIATGANNFFCLNKSKVQEYQILPEYLSRCICHSRDIRKAVFTGQDFALLSEKDKTVYVLNISKDQVLNESISRYLALGEASGVPDKHLPSHRHPWYRMEQKKAAPIWVTNASREGMKFIRNLAGIHSLTTFHSVYLYDEYTVYTDLLFCYFLTPIAQSILRGNRKELGNGLEKFQPSDLSAALVLDITKISEGDKDTILKIYEQLCSSESDESVYIARMNDIFSSYMQ